MDDIIVGLINVHGCRRSTADRLCWAGNGIINADGDLWKVQRKAGLRFFSPANLKSLVDVVLPLHLAETKSYLIQQAQGSTLVDLQYVFLDFTTRLMGKLAYDVCINRLIIGLSFLVFVHGLDPLFSEHCLIP